MITQTRLISAMIANSGMTERQFFAEEITRWKASEKRKNQLTGERYYRGDHDIRQRKRTVVGRDGKLEEVKNLPNNRIVDNQYGKMVDQKTNYLLGKPFKVQTEDEKYGPALKSVFDRKFKRTLQNVEKSALKAGIGWVYIYYDDRGNLAFKRLNPHEILPFWKDGEHTELDCVVRVYELDAYEGVAQTVVERVEIYWPDRIDRYILDGGVLIPDNDSPSVPYIRQAGDEVEAEGLSWGKVPIVAVKYNDLEIPLICKVKCIQDAINEMLSDFQNNMQEDSRNTVLVIRNYDGEDLGEFRHNLAAYGAVKVRSEGADGGGVDTLRVEISADNYKAILEVLKRAMVENAMGFDAKDLRSSSPNQMNIQSMYSDVDLDANGMETELQASFEQLLWFINIHLASAGKGDFEAADVEIVFDRDMMMNEADAISSARKSVGILSHESVLAHHPWVSDPKIELGRIAIEKQGDEYYTAFMAAMKKKGARAKKDPMDGEGDDGGP